MDANYYIIKLIYFFMNSNLTLTLKKGFIYIVLSYITNSYIKIEQQIQIFDKLPGR